MRSAPLEGQSVHYDNPYTKYGDTQLGTRNGTIVDYISVPLSREAAHDLAEYQRGSYSRINQCGTCGAIITQSSTTQHSNFHKTFSNRKDATMSTVLWCDYGHHAYKADSPGSATFDATTRDKDGVARNVTMDACADHNPLRTRPDVIAKELEAEYPVTMHAHNID